MEIKECTTCNIEKPTSAFYPRDGRKFGVVEECKECESVRSKKYYRANRETIINKVKERSKHNKKDKAVYDKEYNIINKIKLARQKENARLKRKYKITLDEYFDMLFKQDYRCLGCGKHQSDIEWALCVDHDHKCCSGEKSCGKCIRGLLCCHCNHSIGSAEDDQQILKNLVVYLESFKKQKGETK